MEKDQNTSKGEVAIKAFPKWNPRTIDTYTTHHNWRELQGTIINRKSKCS